MLQEIFSKTFNSVRQQNLQPKIFAAEKIAHEGIVSLVKMMLQALTKQKHCLGLQVPTHNVPENKMSNLKTANADELLSCMLILRDAKETFATGKKDRKRQDDIESLEH